MIFIFLGGLLQAYGKTESQQNLIFDSRSGSSMDGSLMNSYMSQFTNLTSISSLSSSSSIYSIPSIYRLDDKQISWNKDRPIGEGKFRIRYSDVSGTQKPNPRFFFLTRTGPESEIFWQT